MAQSYRQVPPSPVRRSYDGDGPLASVKIRKVGVRSARKIPRDLNENARDVARALASTPEYEAACRRRKKVEMLFAHLKRILRVGRLRLRGPCGAKDEFLLAATSPGRLSAPACAGGIQGLEPEPRSRKHIDYFLELRPGHGL
jgi:hypothetical protein